MPLTNKKIQSKKKVFKCNGKTVSSCVIAFLGKKAENLRLILAKRSLKKWLSKSKN
jgi:hypothetical protein